ncbi:odorant receptor 94a-like [Anastrepha ludens]|uniref:odorant receptor 94a-like n=1 Tax=Anastrepha ludens TaxID=28586 RepID=UPI0023B0B44F|nr:odorant receptor 94a-like [Anastrepha ludens]
MSAEFFSSASIRAQDRISATRIIVLLLRVLDLWQFPDYNSKRPHFVQNLWRLYGLLLHLTITVPFMMAQTIAALLSHDLDEFGNILYLLLAELTMMAKILHIWRHSNLACRYLDEAAHEPKYALYHGNEWMQWKRQQSSFALIAYSYILGCVFIVLIVNLGILLTPPDIYVLPCDLYVPFEWQNRRYYWYAYGFANLGLVMVCIANSTLDMLFCYFMLHLALLYELIGKRLMALRRQRQRVVGGGSEVLDELREIFQMHVSVKRFTVQCETLVSVPVLSQIILSAFILCFGGYRIRSMHIMEEFATFFPAIQYISAMVLEIYLLCYYGNAVTVNSDALTNAIFNSDWTEFDVPTRKFMILYMELLKKPTTLKAGNFFQVGLPIFTKTLNNAYAFFALLLNTNK